MQEILTLALKDGELKVIVDKDLMELYGVSEEDLIKNLNYELLNDLKDNIVSIFQNGTLLKEEV